MNEDIEYYVILYHLLIKLKAYLIALTISVFVTYSIDSFIKFGYTGTTLLANDLSFSVL